MSAMWRLMQETPAPVTTKEEESMETRKLTINVPLQVYDALGREARDRVMAVGALVEEQLVDGYFSNIPAAPDWEECLGAMLASLASLRKQRSRMRAQQSKKGTTHAEK